MVSHRNELLAGVLLMAVGGFFLHQASLIADSQDDLIGPRFVPIAVSIAVIGLALLILLVNGFRYLNSNENLSGFWAGFSKQDLLGLWGPAVVVLCGFLYIQLFDYFGYLLSSFIVLLLMLGLFKNRPLLRNVIKAVIGTLIYFYLFAVLMGLYLPQGQLFDLAAFLGW